MTCHASAAAAHTAHSSEFSLQCSERDGARWFAQSIVAEYCFSAGMVLAISLPKPPLFTLSIILPEFLPNQIAHRWIFFRRGKSRWRVPRRQCRAGSAGALPLASKGEGRCQPPPPLPPFSCGLAPELAPRSPRLEARAAALSAWPWWHGSVRPWPRWLTAERCCWRSSRHRSWSSYCAPSTLCRWLRLKKTRRRCADLECVDHRPAPCAS